MNRQELPLRSASPALRYFRLVLLSGWALLALGCGSAKPAPQVAKPPEASTAPAPDPDAWRRQMPAPSAAREVQFPKAQHHKFPNGLNIYLLQHPGTLSLTLLTKSGALSASAEKSGVAALTARMLTEGTTRKSALKLAEAVEDLGTELHHDAGREYSSIGLECLPEDMGSALGLLAEVVLTPSFRPKDFARVQQQWLDELQAERQSPSRLASLIGLSEIFGPERGAPVNGRPKDVKKLRRQDLRSFHRRTYRPHNAALIVVGPVEMSQVVEQAKRHLYAWRGTIKPSGDPEPFPPAPSELTVKLLDRPGAVQSAIFAAHRAPPRSEPGYETRNLMNTLFGGLFTSRLNLNLREQHAYTYGAGSFLAAGRSYGLFGISTSVRTDVTGDALEQIIKELDELKNPKLGRPITQMELAAARAERTQGIFASLEHVSRVSSRLETLFLQSLPLDYYRTLPESLANISLAEVQSATEAVKKKALTVVIVGDRSKIEAPIRALGLSVSDADESLIE